MLSADQAGHEIKIETTAPRLCQLATRSLRQSPRLSRGQFQQMPTRIAKADAASTIPLVDFHVIEREGPAAIRQPLSLHSTENLVDFGLSDFERIMMWLE